MSKDPELEALVEKTAAQAHMDGVDPGDQLQLVGWIRKNCAYNQDNEFYLVLLIGSRLADLRAQEKGFKHQVDMAFTMAEAKLAHEPGVFRSDAGSLCEVRRTPSGEWEYRAATNLLDLHNASWRWYPGHFAVTNPKYGWKREGPNLDEGSSGHQPQPQVRRTKSHPPRLTR